MKHAFKRQAIVLAVLASAASTGAAQVRSAEPLPPFRTSVGGQQIDVTVVDGEGRPVPDLTAADFRVFVEEKPWRVASAEWVPVARESAPAATVSLPDGYSSNDQTTTGRLLVLAIDQPNIHAGAGRAILSTLNGFIDRLPASFRVAVVGFGPGGASTPFTTDRERVKAVVQRLDGQRHDDIGRHGLSLAAATAISLGDETRLEEAVSRDCRDLVGAALRACKIQIQNEATALVGIEDHQRDLTLRALQDLLIGLEGVDAPKTIVLVSEGLALFDKDRETLSRLADIGARAAATRTSIHALWLEGEAANASAIRTVFRPFEDARIRMDGLSGLALAAGGTVYRVAGSAAAAVDRLERALSGYYLVGIDGDLRDIDQRSPSSLRVEVARRGATVRVRRVLVASESVVDFRHWPPQRAVAAALAAPLVISRLPLRAISFSLPGSDASKVQEIVHVDIGTAYTSPQNVAVAYAISDREGRLVESKSLAGQLTPSVPGAPSSLSLMASTSLPPGEYMLKLAVSDGDRIGSVEHPIRAALRDAGTLKVSDLIVGAPIPSEEPTRPTVGDVARFGVVQGYLETYGATADVSVRYDIVSDDQGPALVGEDVAGRMAGESRMQFSRFVSVGAVPPGHYRFRATVSMAGTPAAVVSRGFEIAAAGALSPTIPSGASVPPAKMELFLPVQAGDLAMPFRLADALRDETLRPFTERVPPALKAQFDQGIGQLRQRDYPAAEQAFKRVLAADADASSALSYLAVTFAAAGHDFEASSAWQTALVSGSDLPQIYGWLAEALLRAHELGRARSVLEEAIGRWPADGRFTRPLAVLYATSGRGYEAIDLLDRYNADHAGDADAMYLAIQWIVHVHESGRVVHTAAEDVTLARRYAENYVTAKGTKQALVKQWLAYLENPAR